jgi:hypothetical protein
MQELFVCSCSVLSWTKNVYLQYFCKMSVMVEIESAVQKNGISNIGSISNNRYNGGQKRWQIACYAAICYVTCWLKKSIVLCCCTSSFLYLMCFEPLLFIDLVWHAVINYMFNLLWKWKYPLKCTVCYMCLCLRSWIFVTEWCKVARFEVLAVMLPKIQVISDVTLDRWAVLGPLDLWRWRHHNPLKHSHITVSHPRRH